MDTLLKASEKLNYRMEDNFSGYLHGTSKHSANILNLVSEVLIDYTFPYNIQWIHDKENNIYKRYRGGKPEIEKNDMNQVGASVIIIMKTDSKYISKDYMNVNVVGDGEVEIYQNGIKISGRWSKDLASINSKLFFYDSENKEIEFVPGNIWVEIVTDQELAGRN